MQVVQLSKTMIRLKNRINGFPKVYNDLMYKALNPSLTVDQRLVYIRKVKLYITTMLGMLSDIEKEISNRPITE